MAQLVFQRTNICILENSVSIQENDLYPGKAAGSCFQAQERMLQNTVVKMLGKDLVTLQTSKLKLRNHLKNSSSN